MKYLQKFDSFEVINEEEIFGINTWFKKFFKKESPQQAEKKVIQVVEQEVEDKLDSLSDGELQNLYDKLLKMQKNIQTKNEGWKQDIGAIMTLSGIGGGLASLIWTAMETIQTIVPDLSQFSNPQNVALGISAIGVSALLTIVGKKLHGKSGKRFYDDV